MRVTQHMIAKSTLEGMQSNLQKLSKVQQQAVTGKAISAPSDDPFGVEQSLGYRYQIDRGESTLRNIALSQDWLYATDAALSDGANLISRTERLTLQGLNDALGLEERQSISLEINQIIEETLVLANTQHGDHYLFAGTKFNTAPFDTVRVNDDVQSTIWQGDNNQILREIEPGSQVPINVDGQSVFEPLLQTLIGLRDELIPENGTPPAAYDRTLVEDRLTELKTHLDTMTDEQATVGTKSRRLATSSERIEAAQVGLKALLSQVEDADMGEVISELQQREFLYQTALNVGARVTRTSLLDFLG